MKKHQFTDKLPRVTFVALLERRRFDRWMGNLFSTSCCSIRLAKQLGATWRVLHF